MAQKIKPAGGSGALAQRASSSRARQRRIFQNSTSKLMQAEIRQQYQMVAIGCRHTQGREEKFFEIRRPD